MRTWEPRGLRGKAINENYPPDIAKKRRKEQAVRRRMACYRAWALLAQDHPEEFAELLQAMKTQIREERGPLPGDKDYQE